MKSSVEEAIERLEKGMNDICFSVTYSKEEEEKDLKILLTDYKRVLNENEELKEIIARKNGEIQNLEADLFENASNYVIPKQRIKDKIEALKQEGNYRSIDNPYGRVHFVHEECDYKIEVLQELLESEEKQC